jgi:hypothetical protein
MARAETVFSWLAFPVVMAAAVAGALLLLEQGASATTAFFVPIAGTTLFVLIAEWIFPHQRAWLKPRGDVGVDAAYAVVIGATGGLLQPVIAALAIPIAAAL